MVRAFLPKAVLLLVFTLLVAAPIQATGSRPPGSIPEDGHSILAQVWDFLTGAWAEIGCGIDPDGRCVPPPNPTADIGCGIDPNGGCGH